MSFFFAFPPLASKGRAPKRVIYDELAFAIVGKPLACWPHKLLPYLWADRTQSTALVSNRRLAGPLLSDSTDNKEKQKKGSQRGWQGCREGTKPWYEPKLCSVPTTHGQNPLAAARADRQQHRAAPGLLSSVSGDGTGAQQQPLTSGNSNDETSKKF